MANYKQIIEQAKHVGRETLAQSSVRSRVDRLEEKIEQLASPGETQLFHEHADYLHKRIKHLDSAVTAYDERRGELNFWEKIDRKNCNKQASLTREALDTLHEQYDAIRERVYEQGVRVLNAIKNPTLLEHSTALVTDVYRDSRPKTVKQYQFLDQLYLVGNEDTLKLKTGEERTMALLQAPTGIRRTKWELLLAVANATSDLGLISHMGKETENDGLLKAIASIYVDLSLQERSTENVHITGGYRMYVNTGYHSLRAAVKSAVMDHEAIGLLTQEFNEGQHPHLDRDATIRTFHAIRQERALGLLLHDLGEGRGGELSTAATFKGMTKEQEQDLRKGKGELEHEICFKQIDYARPVSLRNDDIWLPIRDHMRQAYDIVEGKGFEAGRGKVVDRAESQRTHLYANAAKFIPGEQPRSYLLADTDERNLMLNYISIPLHGRPVLVDDKLDYNRPLGNNALVTKIEQHDPMLKAIQQASLVPLEKEYLHIQRQIHKAMGIDHAPGFQGKQGESNKGRGI